MLDLDYAILIRRVTFPRAVQCSYLRISINPRICEYYLYMQKKMCVSMWSIYTIRNTYCRLVDEKVPGILVLDSPTHV